MYHFIGSCNRPKQKYGSQKYDFIIFSIAFRYWLINEQRTKPAFCPLSLCVVSNFLIPEQNSHRKHDNIVIFCGYDFLNHVFQVITV